VQLEYTRERRGKLEGTGEFLTLPCDQLFKAIGQTFAVDDIAGPAAGPALESGRIRIDAERRTSIPGLWAGGDCAAGGRDLTVVAVEDGKIAAASIDAHLKSKAPA
jgi:glutamate synthase (NADPH/NADH) small chain